MVVVGIPVCVCLQMAARFFFLRIANSTSPSFKQQHGGFPKFSLAKLRGDCSSAPCFSTNATARSTPTHADGPDFRHGASPASSSSAGVKTSPTAWWGPDPDTGMWGPAREGQRLPFTGSVPADEQEPWFRENVDLHDDRVDPS